MREVASVVESELCNSSTFPALVLSAMGRATNLLIAAGERALELHEAADVCHIPELQQLAELHLHTCDELKLDSSCKDDVQSLLDSLERILSGVSVLQELSRRGQAYLVSFGERMSTRIFAGLLRARGIHCLQYDSAESGMLTVGDDPLDADVAPEAYEQLRNSFAGPLDHVPVITGFIGRSLADNVVTTLGRGGSDLSATALAAALDDSRECVLFKDTDGVLSADPRLCRNPQTIETLTFDEAAEIAFWGAPVLHPQAMEPCTNVKDVPVRVRNSYNLNGPTTIIQRQRELNELMTALVCKHSVTMVDVTSLRSLGRSGFLSSVFNTLRDNGISADVVSTSEVSVSFTLDSYAIWSRDLVDEELEALREQLSKIGSVNIQASEYCVLSLVCNASRSSTILREVFHIFEKRNMHPFMLSQGSSKTSISMMLRDDERLRDAIEEIHSVFFDGEGNPSVPVSFLSGELEPVVIGST